MKTKHYPIYEKFRNDKKLPCGLTEKEWEEENEIIKKNSKAHIELYKNCTLGEAFFDGFSKKK